MPQQSGKNVQAAIAQAYATCATHNAGFTHALHTHALHMHAYSTLTLLPIDYIVSSSQGLYQVLWGNVCATFCMQQLQLWVKADAEV